jgi:hypothetical protein
MTTSSPRVATSEVRRVCGEAEAREAEPRVPHLPGPINATFKVFVT